MNDQIVIEGEFLIECWNPDGSLAWRRMAHNAPTNQGLDYLAGVAFTGVAQSTTWYAGAIDVSGFTALAATDTMSSHTGWSEFTGYSGARPTWVNTEAGQQVSSNGSFSFPITVNGTIHGLFITSGSARSGTTGTLWCTALLSSDAVVSVGQTVTGTYLASFAGG